VNNFTSSRIIHVQCLIPRSYPMRPTKDIEEKSRKVALLEVPHANPNSSI
jgi:hypothetical protein